jgi:uroporphyrinogen decarboxylase
MERSQNCLEKLERMYKTLRHEEADRVPVSDFFWGSFLDRWKEELGLPSETDIYRHYDLDWIATIPNMDPHIKQFEILEQSDEQVVVRTGFEAVIRKKYDDPMPAYLEFDTDSIEKMRAFQFDDPWDERRYFSGGDNQVAGVGDSFIRDLPPWMETVKKLHPDFPVYGSVCEGHECLWRIVGSENVLLWIGLYPDELGRFIDRIHEFNLGIAEAQIEAASGLLDGMVIWGDVAYRRDLLFSPDYWRRYFKPGVKNLVDLCHRYDLPVIYHGCGNVNKILEDYIELGVDAYNPLEAKAGLDVIDLRRRFGHRMGFCGNMDVMVWADAPMDELDEYVVTKLNAAKGGGFIFQSDHSVPNSVSGERYDHVVNLVRKRGVYPLDLGQYDLPDIS